ESQCPFRLSPLLLQFIGTAVTLRIDRARAHEDKISEMSGEFAPDPVQRVHATPPVRARHENSCRLLGFQGRGSCRGPVLRRQRFISFTKFAPDLLVVCPIEKTK